MRLRPRLPLPVRTLWPVDTRDATILVPEHAPETADLLSPALLVASVAIVSADATDGFVRAEMKRQNIPGLSLAVVKDGVVIKAAGYGVADLKTKAV